MDRETIIKKLTGAKIKDYSYAIIFFLVFSFFLFAVIRPNITTVFNLQAELDNLQAVDKSYNNVIDKIITIQTVLENTRDNIFVFDEALPAKPELNKLIDSFKQTATDANVNLNKLTINKIDLKQDKKQKDTNQIEINAETTASFDEINNFIKLLLNQRRLKTIKNISITKNGEIESTSSGKINIKFVVDSFYL